MIGRDPNAGAANLSSEEIARRLAFTPSEQAKIAQYNQPKDLSYANNLYTQATGKTYSGDPRYLPEITRQLSANQTTKAYHQALADAGLPNDLNYFAGTNAYGLATGGSGSGSGGSSVSVSGPQIVGGGSSMPNVSVGGSGGGSSGFTTIADMVKPYTERRSIEGMGFAGIEGRLKSLLDDPESITKSAAYKFRVGQGQEALQRSMAAKGLLGSGNRLMELTKYGQDMASQEYDNQFNRLGGLMGKYMDSDDRRLAGLLGTAQNVYSTNVGAGMDKYRTDVGASTSRYGIQTGANTSAAQRSSAERMAEEERLSRERQNNLNNIYNWSNYRDPLDVNRIY